MKKKKWTKAEAVDWLKKRVALGECESAEERYLPEIMDYPKFGSWIMRIAV